MLKKMDESAGNVIGFQAIDNLDKADFATLSSEVRTLIDEVGSARLLIDFEECASENVSAWEADLKFASKYHGKIEKLAIVGDQKWQKNIAGHEKHFYAKETEFFGNLNRASAWHWVRE